MNLDQFDTYILVPALKVVNMYSLSAHVLMLGTIVHESQNLKYIEQIGPGTAMGFPQIEKPTHEDVKRYLNRWDNKNLKEVILAACFYTCFPGDDALIHNLRYAVLVARVKYWMISKPIPEWNDAKSLSQYYKRYYNSSDGKADLNVVENTFANIIKTRFKG